MEKIELFRKKSDCCACGACMNICPKQAISMVEDEYGFIYPKIDEKLCISCGACKRVCGYQNVQEENNVLKTYVACTQTTDIMQSASGGVFAGLAKEFLKQGGVVYGATLELNDGELIPKHVGVERECDLYKLLGSKYVQSNLGSAYSDIRVLLSAGKKVLFSGTPCQVAGLKAFLGKKEYENLLLVDIICHGVPSASFFNSYLDELAKKINGKITDFKFRDKTKGWGYVGKVCYITAKNQERVKRIYARESSYYQFFLAGEIGRENCYECRYASEHRSGDITLGDYWGIEKEHPDYLVANGGCFDECRGVSCMLINTQKGQEYVRKCGKSIRYMESTFEKAARKNGQLVHPIPYSERRNKVLTMYKEYGYNAVDRYFRKELGFKIIPIYVIGRIPVYVKKWIRRVIR